MSSQSDIALLGRLVAEVRPYKWHLVVIFVLSLLATPVALLMPLPLKLVVDSVLGSEPLPQVLQPFVPSAWTSSPTALLIFSAAMMLSVALLGELRGFLETMLRTYTAEKLTLDFRTRLFSHVQRLSLLYHDLLGTGDSAYRIQYDTNAVQYIAINGIIPFFTSLVTLVAMLFVITKLDPQIALVALAISPVLFFIARSYRSRLRHQSRKLRKIESQAFSVIPEVLGALRVVKAFGQEDREKDRFQRHLNRGLFARLRLTAAEGALGILLVLTTTGGTALVLYIGVRHVQAGTLTLGGLLLVMAYLSQLYAPLQTISRKFASVQSHLARAERAYALLDEPVEVRERPGARSLVRARGDIEFDDVTFSYDGAAPVLSNVDFRVESGTIVGLAGRTGAGKTTLMSLLMRFYDPSSGVIRLDGVDLRDLKLASLRDQFAIVLQDPILFSTSISDNIAYARPGVSRDAIEDAARAANVHDFIMSLPEGYDTRVGERGMRLSGGERQRVAIARAFLKDAPILVLDEPTSSVDMRTEAAIFEAMQRLMVGRTTFMIAHRLTTLRDCHMLLLVENRRVRITSDVTSTVERALVAGGI